jgi:hypothetical protein
MVTMATDQDVQKIIDRVNGQIARGEIVPAGKKKQMMTDEDLQKIIDNYNANKKKPFLKESSLGIGAGLEKAMSGLTRILAKLPSKNLKYLNSAVQAYSKHLNDEFDRGQPDLINKGVREGSNIAATILTPVIGEESLGYSALKLSPDLVKSASSIFENAPSAAKIAGKALKSVPEGALIGAMSVDPDEGMTTGALIGALLGPAGSLAGDAVGFGIKALTKKNAIEKIAQSSDATPEELQNILNSSKGSAVLAGNALKDPTVLKMESNTLPSTAGFKSSAINKLKKITGSLNNQANGIFNKLSMNIGKSELSNSLVDMVTQNTKKLQARKRALYKTSNNIAKKIGTKVSLDNFGKTAKKLKNNFSKVANETGVEKSGEGVNALKKIINKVYPKVESNPGGLILPQYLIDDMNNINRGKVGSTSLSTANFAKSALSNKAYKYKVSGDADLSSIYSQLAEALEKDINDYIEDSDSDSLKKAYNEAQKYYKENIVPLKDKNISGILNTKIDPNNITSTFIPSGEKGKGRINLLNKILKNAPGSEKYLLTDYLSPAFNTDEMGNMFVSPGKLLSLLNGLGDDRLSMLIKDPQTISKINDFKSNMKNGMDALQYMTNFKTGYATIANNNYIAEAQIMSSMLSDLFKGSTPEIAANIISYGSKLAQGRAINDPDLIKNVIKIKSGSEIPSSATYKIANNSPEAIKTIAQVISSLLASNT